MADTIRHRLLEAAAIAEQAEQMRGADVAAMLRQIVAELDRPTDAARGIDRNRPG